MDQLIVLGFEMWGSGIFSLSLSPSLDSIGDSLFAEHRLCSRDSVLGIVSPEEQSLSCAAGRYKPVWVHPTAPAHEHKSNPRNCSVALQVEFKEFSRVPQEN